MASIAEILMAQGRAAAESRRSRAGVWQPFISQLSNLPGQIIQDRQVERDRSMAQREQTQRMDLNQQRLSAGERDAAKEVGTQQKQDHLRAVLDAPGVFDPTKGELNMDAATAAAGKIGATYVLPDLQAINDARATAHVKQLLDEANVKRAEAETAKALRPDTEQTDPTKDYRVDGKVVQAGVPEVKPDTRPINVQLAEAIKRGDMTAASAMRQAIREAAAEGRDPNVAWQMAETARHNLAMEENARNTKIGRPLIAGDVEDISNVDEGIKLAKALNFKSGDTGVMPSVTGAMPNWVTSTTGIGVEAKSRQGQINLVKQIIGKGLEGGVLRKEDEEKYKLILPTLSDADEVVQSKIKGLIRTLEQKRATRLDALEDANYNVTKFRARSNAQGGATDQPAPAAPTGWKYVPKPGGGWTAVADK